MSESERTAAFEWAATARSARFGLRDQLQSGELLLADVLARAGNDPLLGQVKLLWTLESVPGASKVLTRRKLAELGIAESTRIGSLSDEQQELIHAHFGA